jgi:uncharacterized linocin/CFP29 family protein
MDILKRNKAPFSEAIWGALEEEAQAVFSKHLTGRKVVDFNGPHGLAFSGVNTGRVSGSKEKLAGASVGVRESLAVVELKVPFEIKESELELIMRGASAFNAEPIVQAARTLCEAENSLIFDGYKKASIGGVVESLEQKPVKVKGDDILPGVAEAVKTLANDQVEGPYALLIQPQYYAKLFSAAGNAGYPLTKKLSELLQGGEVLTVPTLTKGAMVMSLRGGDYEILSGVDIAMGYNKETASGHELFLFESLTFRINTPEAAIALEW